MEWSTSIFLLAYTNKHPMLWAAVREIAEFTSIMNELSRISGLSVTACADIVRNTAEESGESWRKVAAYMKHIALSGGKIHG
jgi:hypothetical protein